MFPRLLPATRALLIANVVVYLLQLASGREAMVAFELWPLDLGDTGYGYPFMLWQPLSSGFMHGGLAHLLFNMLALWMFGSPLEQVWGQKRYLTFYFVCLLGASLCQLVVSTWLLASGGPAVSTVGASGAIFGLLLGYGMLFPNQRMIVFPIPMEIKARTLVIIYGALTLFYGITGTQAGVAHFAHLGGMVFGWLMIRYWRGQPPFGRGRRGPPRMRVVK